MNIVRAGFLVLSVGLAAVPALAAERFAERFTEVCRTGPLIDVLLRQSFSAEKTRPAFCSCLLERIGPLDPGEEDFVVRVLGKLDSDAFDRQHFAAAGERLEAAFDACLAAQDLAPPRD